jgi:DNA-binding IclR family transcriptional regulator
MATRKTVDKAMEILHAFSDEQAELSIAELSRRLGMHKSVVSRLVATLREWRMVEQNPTSGRLRLGVGTFELGMRFANQEPLRRVALPLLAELVKKTKQSAHVSILDGWNTLVIATVESPEALRVIMRLGDRRMLHATAAGKVLLAYHPESMIDDLARETGLPALTPTTLTDIEALRKAVARVRRQGIAWNDGESTRGAGAVAAPIFGAGGQIAAALSCVYPLAVATKAQRVTIAREVKRIAAEISVAMGAGYPAAAKPGER